LIESRASMENLTEVLDVLGSSNMYLKIISRQFQQHLDLWTYTSAC